MQQRQQVVRIRAQLLLQQQLERVQVRVVGAKQKQQLLLALWVCAPATTSSQLRCKQPHVPLLPLPLKGAQQQVLVLALVV